MSNELNQLAKKFHAYLRKEYSDIKTILKYRTQFQLLVSIVLSAQTTDENVNKATKGLFKEYPNAKSLASAKLKSIERLVAWIKTLKGKKIKLIPLSAMSDLQMIE